MTAAQVAEEAGVSTATVSRALSGAGGVSAATARRVRQVAERLGYAGNTIASALRRRSTGNIGMVVPSIANPFFTRLVDHVELQLAELNLGLFLCDSRNSVEVEASRLLSLTRGNVDGLLVSPFHSEESREALERAAALVPVVQIDRRVPVVSTDWVGLDDDHAMATVVEHVANRGARSAALVTSTLGSSSAQYRLDSTRRACRAMKVKLAAGHVLDGEFSLDWGADAARRLLSEPSLPDAIICSDDVIALGLVSTLSMAGVRVGEDVIVTGIDDIDFASISSPPLTTLRQPLRQMATEAVRLLQETIRTPDRARQTISLQGRLQVRASSTPEGSARGGE